MQTPYFGSTQLVDDKMTKYTRATPRIDFTTMAIVAVFVALIVLPTSQAVTFFGSAGTVADQQKFTYDEMTRLVSFCKTFAYQLPASYQQICDSLRVSMGSNEVVAF